MAFNDMDMEVEEMANTETTEKKSRKPREEMFTRLKWTELAVFNGLKLDRKATLEKFEAAMDTLEEEVEAAGRTPAGGPTAKRGPVDIDLETLNKVRDIAVPLYKKKATPAIDGSGNKVLRRDLLANAVFFGMYPGDLPESKDPRVSEINAALEKLGFKKYGEGAGQFYPVIYTGADTDSKSVKRK